MLQCAITLAEVHPAANNSMWRNEHAGESACGDDGHACPFVPRTARLGTLACTIYVESPSSHEKVVVIIVIFVAFVIVALVAPARTVAISGIARQLSTSLNYYYTMPLNQYQP